MEQRITRVDNGWIVYVNDPKVYTSQPLETYVAETIERLARIVTEICERDLAKPKK